jgi:hypothetical protein
MREQENSLNPQSDKYSSGGVLIEYYETNSTFKQGSSNNDARIAGFRGALTSEHFFLNIGALQLRENEKSVNGNNVDRATQQFSRVYLGGRYNKLEYIGFSGGFLLTESPKLTDNSDSFSPIPDKSSDLFLNVSLLGANLLLVDLQEENLYVETTSYGYEYSGYNLNIERSKIHEKSNNEKKYSDEYIIDIGYQETCTSLTSATGYCGINLQRRSTFNDDSQGWTINLNSPFLKFNINTFDQKSELRRKKYGFGLQAGIDLKNIIDTNKSFRILAGIHLNDGSNKILEVPDELMIGITFEITGLINLFSKLGEETYQEATPPPPIPAIKKEQPVPNLEMFIPRHEVY